MKKIELLFDVDGVIANLSQAVVDIVNEYTGRSYTVFDVTSPRFSDCFEHDTLDVKTIIDEKMSSPGFVYSLQPYDGAIVFIEKMRTLGNVCFVTSPHLKSETWAYERTKWLKRYFNASHNDVYFAHDKSRIRGNVFVDDTAANVSSWAGANDPAFSLLFSRPYNKRDIVKKRVSSYDEITEVVHSYVSLYTPNSDL